MIGSLPHRIVIAAAWLALACWVLPMSDANARENRKNGSFCLVIGFFVFVQIVITPQAGGPHHHSMLFPLPVLACAFLTRSLYDHFHTIRLSTLVTITEGAAAATAICLCLVNANNTMVYLSHFRNNPQYKPLWSPAIYSLSRYINGHGRDSQKIILVDCCIEQLHVLAPKKIRGRIRDFWPDFKQLPKTRDEQNAMLANIFPEGRTLVVTFDASKEQFPETRKNFFALLSTHPELNYRLVTEFWYGGERIYELYEVVRLPHQTTAADE
jgi:hypothetical protein